MGAHDEVGTFPGFNGLSQAEDELAAIGPHFVVSAIDGLLIFGAIDPDSPYVNAQGEAIGVKSRVVVGTRSNTWSTWAPDDELIYYTREDVNATWAYELVP